MPLASPVLSPTCVLTHALALALLSTRSLPRFHPGENVIIGRDYTISAKIEGWVEFTKKKIRDGMRRHHWVQYINVRPGTREEHRERVRARVHARNNKPMSNRLWTLTQMGHFADRGEPASAASS